MDFLLHIFFLEVSNFKKGETLFVRYENMKFEREKVDPNVEKKEYISTTYKLHINYKKNYM